MVVGEKDRKVLWGRSGNRCAHCRRVLVADRTAEDREAVVGEEAHIAAQSPGGPRWGQPPPGIGVDTYENLILLCRVDHKKVDDQPGHYTVERLHQMKDAHEAWVHGRLEEEKKLPGLHDPIVGTLPMECLTTGGAVWQLIADSDAYLLNSPADGEAEDEAVDLADEFLELCRDYGDIHTDISDQGMRAVREAKRSLQDYVSRLAGFGLLVFGSRQRRRATRDDPPLVFNVAVIRVIRADDPELVLVEQA